MKHSLRTAGFIFVACLAGVVLSHPLFGADAEPKEAAPAKVIDLAGWESEDAQYSNPVEALTVAEGKQLKITYVGGAKDKAVMWKNLEEQKVSAKGTLRFRVANPNAKTVQITVVVKTGANYTFHESERIAIKPGGETFQDVTIALGGFTFKSQATEWKNTGAIADPDEVRSIQIGIYNGKDSGALIVSDLEIVPKP